MSVAESTSWSLIKLVLLLKMDYRSLASEVSTKLSSRTRTGVYSQNLPRIAQVINQTDNGGWINLTEKNSLMTQVLNSSKL